MQGDVYKSHRLKETFLFIVRLFQVSVKSDNSSALHLLNTNICPFSGTAGLPFHTYLYSRDSDVGYLFPSSHYWFAVSNSRLCASKLITFRESSLKSSKYIGMKEPYIFSLVWSTAGRRRKGDFCFPTLPAKVLVI